ncbi:hypothetical protein [Streptomyces sp. Agncl-13]|uniref:hypothetical protein n=1 Tax=Streptomyces sp. Agncl-13 TaxID=3400628 RepID=UPI003A8759E2
MDRKWLDSIYADIAFAAGGLAITLSWLPAWYSAVPGIFTSGWIVQIYRRVLNGNKGADSNSGGVDSAS